MPKRPGSSKAVAAVPADYAPLLADIKARVKSARIRAGLAANRELLVLYWDIGRLILNRQRKEGWGTKVIDRLSSDLQREFPGQQGFSLRNLKYMRAFAEAWPETVMVQASLAQAVRSMPAVMHQPGAQLPWKHHCVLLDKLSSPEDRLWYLSKPIGVSGYVTKWVNALPWELKGAVPSVAELEKGLALK